MKKKAVTEFLNVDLDIAGDASELQAFMKSIKGAVVVLKHEHREASFELTHESGSLEETVTNLVDFIGALEPEARSIWNRFELRRANIGIQAESEPRAACFSISAKAVEQLAAVRFEIVFTVYAAVGG
jgi:hypothetical protein